VIAFNDGTSGVSYLRFAKLMTAHPWHSSIEVTVSTVTHTFLA